MFAAGPDRLLLDTTVRLRGENMRTVGEFDLTAGQEVAFSFSGVPSYHSLPTALRAAESLAQVESFWSAWISKVQSHGEWSEAVLRSLLTLKSLAHRETGGIVAAATTSLPEKLGGSCNWDYRYCWLRDATFTLYALIGAGFLDEARAWREWLVRAIGGSPDKLQIMYGVAGERRVANLFESVDGPYGARGRFDTEAKSTSWEMITDRHRTAFWLGAGIGLIAGLHLLARRLRV